MPIHVDNLLIASNSKGALSKVKTELATHFKIHNQGLTKLILSMNIQWDQQVHTISLSQPGYIKLILDQFGMTECNPALMLMDKGQKLSAQMSPDTPEGKLEMRKYPYCELVGKLLYLAIATLPNIAYVVRVLCCFVENLGIEHWNAAKRVL